MADRYPPPEPYPNPERFPLMFSLNDTELSEVLTLATAIPHRHRKAFLREVAEALAAYPEDCRGAGTVHREAARVQRLYATNTMRSAARGV
jgi:hypothetical protein